MAQYILAHDIGTSGDKATLYTTEGCYVDSVTSLDKGTQPFVVCDG